MRRHQQPDDRPRPRVYGIRVADSRQFQSLGKSGDIAKAQHCRAEVFLPDEGWFPLDPADVRKAVLESKFLLGHPDVITLRNRLFGYWEMNWVAYNSATGIVLPDGHVLNVSLRVHCGRPARHPGPRAFSSRHHVARSNRFVTGNTALAEC